MTYICQFDTNVQNNPFNLLIIILFEFKEVPSCKVEETIKIIFNNKWSIRRVFLLIVISFIEIINLI